MMPQAIYTLCPAGGNHNVPCGLRLNTFSRWILQTRQSEWGALATAFHHQQRQGIHVDVHGQEGEELSEKDYHRLADLTLGEIMVKLEALIEETPGLADSDLEYSQVPPLTSPPARLSQARRTPPPPPLDSKLEYS